MAQTLRRYLWLIDTVNRAGNITYEEIRRRWMDSPVNDTGERDYPKRTFLGHIEGIKELFGLSILCNRRNGYKYYLAPEEREPERLELMGTLSLSMKLLENQALRERVRFTSWSFENPRIHALLEAIENKKAVAITRFAGNDFIEESAAMVTLMQPYYMEFVNHAWFILGYVPERKRMEALRLGLFQDLQVLEEQPFRRDDAIGFEDLRDGLLQKADREDPLDDRRDYRLFHSFAK